MCINTQISGFFLLVRVLLQRKESAYQLCDKLFANEMMI